MRVLLLCHGLPPDSVGGVEQHVSGLAEALAAAGHQVHVFARADLPALDQGAFVATATGNPRVTRVAYRWQGVDSLDATYLCPPMAAALRQFLGERRAAGETFDVAHVHHLTGMSTDALGELAAAGIATVLTLHDYWLFCPRGQMFHRREEVCETAAPARCAECLQATFPHWLDAANRDAAVARIQDRARAALRLPQRLVVPSARAVPPFVALGVPAERFTVVENGVDTQRLHGIELPAAGPGPLRVGYFGTLLPSKGLHVLLDAVLALPPGTVSLRIHGNAVPYHGDESYLTRCFQRLRPGSDVHYGGPYTADELPHLLASVDVLAAPALWHEAFGLTVREGLAAARPVLVSRIGGLQDAVVDGVQGRVLPPGDVAAWRAAIAELAADRALVARLARAARPRARGFQAMAAELLAVYADARAAVAPAT
ncbi:MAG: glycosyltransferase [Planctomycetes bacterium]|nr:glycosyltransferase [Planctomycetota bacterium]